jgi:hypothetical protein
VLCPEVIDRAVEEFGRQVHASLAGLTGDLEWMLSSAAESAQARWEDVRRFVAARRTNLRLSRRPRCLVAFDSRISKTRIRSPMSVLRFGLLTSCRCGILSF